MAERVQYALRYIGFAGYLAVMAHDVHEDAGRRAHQMIGAGMGESRRCRPVWTMLDVSATIRTISPKHRTMKAHILCGIALAAVAALIRACSGIKTYPNDLPKNVRIETGASPGAALEKLNIVLNLYDVDAKCEPAYLGTVALDRPLIELGVPEQKQLYLEVQSGKSDLLSSAQSSSGYGTLLRPYSGHQYLIEVAHFGDRYNVSVRDKSEQSIAVVTRAPLDSCGRP